MNNKDDILLAQAQKIETLKEKKRASRKNHKSKDKKRWLGVFETLHYWSI